MRVHVELEIDKPLRRGAYITSSNEEYLWLSFRAGWNAKEATKEKNTSSRGREASKDQGIYENASPATGDLGSPSSKSIRVIGSVGGNQGLGKGETLGGGSSTRVTRQPLEDLWENSEYSEQVMSILDHGAKSCAQPNIPAPEDSKGQKASSHKGAQVNKPL
nr:hypothetical protein CFP56_51340 [Quercus suber]